MVDERVKRRETRPAPPVETRRKAKPAPLRRVLLDPGLLGTIPKPYTIEDAELVIAKIGLEAWRAMGYGKKRAALQGVTDNAK